MKFNITTSAPATYYWYYEVEADSQEEAERMVEDGEVTPVDTEFEITNDGECIIEVEEAE